MKTCIAADVWSNGTLSKPDLALDEWEVASVKDSVMYLANVNALKALYGRA